MRSLFGLMVASVLTLFIAYTGYIHLRHTADSVEIQTASSSIAKQAKDAETAYSEPQDSGQGVSLAGPLATYMKNHGSEDIETLQPAAWKATESDHVGGSVVGTTNKVLHQAFAVAGTVDLPFDVPAHAYSPKLRGTFRSFIQAGSAPTTAPGDVDFLLLTDQQYAAMIEGHPGDAVFSADATHDQEVNANLPPTLNQPARYHLVFRNISPKTGKRVVQAALEMDF